ncbi:MAG TPA: SDR family NAD(P)-dependent oxidoreductase [Caulobacteraceae bacterium]|nr:SDR family NAD(P)-dependent oxidoreductase [Caulobacteraceae bacterium]
MRLLTFGFGYVGAGVAGRAGARGDAVSAAIRNSDDIERLRDAGVSPVLIGDRQALEAAVATAEAILVTAPPGAEGCPGLAALAPAIARANAFPSWIGYLSTTGVYGDRGGRWVDERSPRAARSVEGARRVAAERDWLQMGRGMGLTVCVFRLPGIYGPGRSAFERLREGRARRIVQKGHVFCRIHRDDIVAGVLASIARPRPGGVYNLVDDEPAPGEAVIEYAAQLLGVEPPSVTTEIPPASARFYAENRRVANARAKAELSWRPAYPTYREGLAAILAGG